jgi:hypothetical protein
MLYVQADLDPLGRELCLLVARTVAAVLHTPYSIETWRTAVSLAPRMYWSSNGRHGNRLGR